MVATATWARSSYFLATNHERMPTMTRDFLLRAMFAGVSAVALNAQTDWPSYGHDPGGMRFSPLKQINTRNVTDLVRAWTYDISAQSPRKRPGEATPLVVGGV